MVKKIALGLGVVVVLAFIFVMTRRTEFAVERSMTMNATPEAAYGSVADFHKWAEWSPWEKLDPAMKRDFSGPASGVGAEYHWVGNDQVGEGRMTVTGAKENERVEIKLDFLKPYASTSTTLFTVRPAGAATTTVTWRMEGKNDSFMGKLFSVFMNMDTMMGPDFEKGLGSMRTVAEAETVKRAQAKAAEAKAPDAPAEQPAAPTANP